MRVALDATPLLGRRTGIGHYTAQLLAALAKGDDELVATAFTFRGRDGLEVPRGVGSPPGPRRPGCCRKPGPASNGPRSSC